MSSTKAPQNTGLIQQSQFQYHNSLHPSIYVAPYTNVSIEIDGDVDKDSWAQVPWSSEFDDIRGPDDSNGNGDDANKNHPSPRCKTNFKIQWDHEYLYILALIYSDMKVPATFKERNSPIYHQDSDFEVFTDPRGSCHFYKELEMNALNTVWNLMLDKPYDDGGIEHSARIAKPGEPLYYEVQRQKTAARLLKGRLNHKDTTNDGNVDNGKESDVLWSVEIALAHTDTLKHQILTTYDNVSGPHIITPKVGERWRINFSRVEKKGDINWTWQPQKNWDPLLHRHIGKVNMHLPDAWGYVQFGPAIGGGDNHYFGQVPLEEIVFEGKGDLLWPAKLAVMNVYYAQKRYKQVKGVFASDLTSLRDLTDTKIIAPFVDAYEMKLTTVEKGKDGYIFTIPLRGSIISVTNNRFVSVDDFITSQS